MIENRRDFWFIRHGQTAWGAEDILKGPQDLELNETGQHQAERACRAIEAHLTASKSIIYSSQLRRAKETAAIIVSNLAEKIPIIEKEGLQERYYGDYRLADPKNYRDYIPEDAESIEVFQQRVQDIFVEIFNQTPKYAETIIVVSHQKVFEHLSEWLSGTKFRLEQGGVCHFKFIDHIFYPEIYDTK